MRLIDADKLLPKLWVCYEENKPIVDAEPTVNAIPVEWITDWLTKQSIPATSYGLDCSAVEKMLDDWEKENERQTDMAE